MLARPRHTFTPHLVNSLLLFLSHGIRMPIPGFARLRERRGAVL
jgi:hypothetical protein